MRLPKAAAAGVAFFLETVAVPVDGFLAAGTVALGVDLLAIVGLRHTSNFLKAATSASALSRSMALRASSKHLWMMVDTAAFFSILTISVVSSGFGLRPHA
jgi:hypothetical protein